MEQQGLPNAGLYDQRAALQWIQDYIHLVGGDKTQVSAWGESAGASSIMHQLVAFGGSRDPLFSKAVMQSPAFGLDFDRQGALENVFRNFTELAGCSGQGVACLRAANAEMLRRDQKVLSQLDLPLTEI
jgi:carboxylesterase type B